jgi:hypothetical protein
MALFSERGAREPLLPPCFLWFLWLETSLTDAEAMYGFVDVLRGSSVDLAGGRMSSKMDDVAFAGGRMFSPRGTDVAKGCVLEFATTFCVFAVAAFGVVAGLGITKFVPHLHLAVFPAFSTFV